MRDAAAARRARDMTEVARAAAHAAYEKEATRSAELDASLEQATAELAASREEAELYGLWLESEGRYDEALGLYNFQEAHLPNERLLAALAALRDPSMSLTADTQSLDAAVRPSHTPFCRQPQNPAVAHILVPTQATAGSVVEEAPGAFPAIDRMLESDGLFAEQVKLHAATLKAAKAQPTLAPKA